MALTWTRSHDWDAENWRSKALCRDSNLDVFFPVGSTGMAADLIEAAKEICQSCAVAACCLEFALETNQEAGVWGGLTEEERRPLRKARLALERADAAAG